MITHKADNMEYTRQQHDSEASHGYRQSFKREMTLTGYEQIEQQEPVHPYRPREPLEYPACTMFQMVATYYNEIAEME